MLRDRRGVTALEFGIVGPIFLVLLIGSIEVGRFIATYVSVAVVVHEAKRAALIDTTLQGSGSIAAPFARRAPLVDPQRLDLRIERAAATGPLTGLTEVTVAADYSFQSFLPRIPPLDVVLPTTISMRASIYPAEIIVYGRR